MSPQAADIYERIKQLPAEEIVRVVDRAYAFLDGLNQAAAPVKKAGRPPGSRNRKTKAVAAQETGGENL